MFVSRNSCMCRPNILDCLLGNAYPLTAIGGIDAERAPSVLATGVGSCAVVRAITEAADVEARVKELMALHRQQPGQG